MMRMLVSVRDVPEALLAAHGGADFIDLKEPRDGALGGLAIATIREIMQALRARQRVLPISATIGTCRWTMPMPSSRACTRWPPAASTT